MPEARTTHSSPSEEGSPSYVVTGIAVHAVGEDEFCWVYIASSAGSNRYVELPADDESYPSKDAALIAAYLAFRKRLRSGSR
ncbi:Uncharacterised protein [Xylophilus ampelinus]|nr:Uncharacterised protein [Xylophilus ampelinus]